MQKHKPRGRSPVNKKSTTKRIPIPLSLEAVQQLEKLAAKDQRSVSGMGAIIYRLGVKTYLQSQGEVSPV